jgi:hypothetical protein
VPPLGRFFSTRCTGRHSSALRTGYSLPCRIDLDRRLTALPVHAREDGSAAPSAPSCSGCVGGYQMVGGSSGGIGV